MLQESTRQDILGVLRTIHEEALESEDGARALAKAIGRPYSTMMRELNPNDAGAKLGVAEWLAIMGVTRKFGALHQTAALFGYRLVPETPAPDAPALTPGGGFPIPPPGRPGSDNDLYPQLA